MNRVIAIFFMLLMSQLSWADIVIVASPGVQAPSISEKDIEQIFTGRRNSIQGRYIKPLDLPEKSPGREAFYKRLMNKDQSQMRMFWARMIFSGKGKAPQAVGSVSDLQRLITTSGRSYISYLKETDVTEDMNVLLKLDD